MVVQSTQVTRSWQPGQSRRWASHRTSPELPVDQGAADPFPDVPAHGQPAQLDGGHGPQVDGPVEHHLGVDAAPRGRPAAGGVDPGDLSVGQQVAAVGVEDPQALQGADRPAAAHPVDAQLQAGEAGADGEAAQLDREPSPLRLPVEVAAARLRALVDEPGHGGGGRRRRGRRGGPGQPPGGEPAGHDGQDEQGGADRAGRRQQGPQPPGGPVGQPRLGLSGPCRRHRQQLAAAHRAGPSRPGRPELVAARAPRLPAPAHGG
jgi:hypothetical protein